VNNILCLVWSQLARIRTPPIVTSDFLYVRFIGDRSIDEMDFGKIQKYRIFEMNKWAEEIKKAETEKERGRKEVSLAMIAANNHYAGFGPGTANLFRIMVDLSELSWEDQQQIQKHLQQRQQKQKEKQDQHVSHSRIVSKKRIKNRQSSLSEFID
jgi:uncharacterized protein YecE (DUF72 family)